MYHFACLWGYADRQASQSNEDENASHRCPLCRELTVPLMRARHIVVSGPLHRLPEVLTPSRGSYSDTDDEDDPEDGHRHERTDIDDSKYGNSIQSTQEQPTNVNVIEEAVDNLYDMMQRHHTVFHFHGPTTIYQQCRQPPS
jgi:hypothetical protein